jgi:hypothetical protein
MSKRKVMKRSLLPIVISSLFLFSCEDLNQIQGEGMVVQEFREISTFHSVVLEIQADVFMGLTTEQADIELIGQQNILDLIDLTVVNGVLYIKAYERFRTNEDLQLFIGPTMLASISNRGSGDIQSLFQLQLDDLEIENTGSGDIRLGLQADDLEIEIRGSGDIDLMGSAESMELDIYSSGDLSAFDMITEDAEIAIYGSGNAEVHVYDLLIANIFGSGSVHYQGNPQIFSQISGSGSLVNRN